ncbi:MAG TPA: hypothetical protein VGZ90_07660 [Puia sp.]|jgi:hypothetical protein|nr:hypothetical protein [Puia sp.]
MKKILFAALLVIIGFGSMAAFNPVRENLVQKFTELYPDAVQVTWIENSETYTVSFLEKGIRSTIIFASDGHLIRATRYYTVDYLPYYLVEAIRERYHDKKIYSVTEISYPGNIDYYIKLEDAKTWTTIKLDSEGDIKVLDKYRKA